MDERMPSAVNETIEKARLSMWLVLGLPGFVFAAWIAAFFAIPRFYGQPAGPGVFGDMFGGLNALFSGLAFAGLIIAIGYQRKELELQRGDLRLTRAEIRGQKIQLAEQNTLLARQSFESTLFQLIRLHVGIVRSMDLSDSTTVGIRITSGQDCLRVFFKRWKSFYGQRRSNHPEEEKVESIRTAYALYYAKMGHEFSNYYRNLEAILEFLDSSDVEPKARYGRTVATQLSDTEMAFLFYHCFSGESTDRLAVLVHRHKLLSDLLSRALLEPEHASLVIVTQPETPDETGLSGSVDD